MTDFEWLDSGPNCSEGHYSMHSKNPHLSPSLYTTFLEIASKVCEDTNNPSLAEYYNYIPYFQLYLRAALIESHSDEELDFLTKKNKLPSIKAIAATLGLELRNYVRNENTVFPFKWDVNCRRVNFKTGDEFTLEWKLPSSSQYLISFFQTIYC